MSFGKRLLLFALAVAGAHLACDFTNFVNTGSTSGEFDDAVTDVSVQPSNFDLTNGQRDEAIVSAFVGSKKLDPSEYRVDASIGGKSSVATIERISSNVVFLKAENKGDCELIVTVGTKEARAQIHVEAASP